MTNLNSKITSVIVYTNRAQVTRDAQAELEQGEHILTFENLPQNTEQTSIQVNGKGNALLRDVKFRKVHFADTPDEKQKELFAEKEKTQDEINLINDKINHAESERAFVEDITRKITSSEKSRPMELEPDNWMKMVEFYRSKLDELDKEIRTAQKLKQQVNAEMDKIIRQINDIGSRKTKTANIVEVTIEVKETGAVQLELSYIVFGPRWIPVYDLRLSTGQKKMNISYNALIQQNTSEDWDNVQLKLSTAQPGIGGTQPKLKPWRIDFYLPRPPAKDRKVRAKTALASMKKMMKTGEKEKFSLEDSLEMEIPEAKVETKATSVVFAIAGANTIKSNNEQHRVTILIKDFPAHFRYSAVPKLTPYAYLKAKVINQTDFPFLPGKSNIFLDSSFVANSELELVAPSEKFWTYIGVDEAIKVEHKLIRKYHSGKGLLTKKERIEYEYVIELKNNKNTKEEIVVRDQLPISGHEDIEVKLQTPEYKTDSDALKKNEHEFLEWFFTLEPGEETKIPLKFSVEYPQNKSLTGL